MAFNKQHKRTGNLFHRPFKRLEINKETHFTQAMVYIHANAVRHKLCGDLKNHKWSSWHSMLSDYPTQLCRHEVLNWFGGLAPFIEAHETMTAYYYNEDVAIEEMG